MAAGLSSVLRWCRGASVFPLLTAVDDSMALVLGPIGAALAAAAVLIAKRGELPPPADQPGLPP